MSYYLAKIALTTLLVVAIAEISKRSSFAAALLASIPLVSVLAMVWLYVDTRDATKVSALATQIFWLVIPSLLLFVLLPVFLKAGINFYLAMGLSMVLTIGGYFATIYLLRMSGLAP